MDPESIKCICDLIPWASLIGQNKIIDLAPFSAIKAGAHNSCPICSLIYGALKEWNGPPHTSKLTPNCACLVEDETGFNIYGDSNFILIKVNCGGEGGAPHVAKLDLSEWSNNSLFHSTSPSQYYAVLITRQSHSISTKRFGKSAICAAVVLKWSASILTV